MIKHNELPELNFLVNARYVASMNNYVSKLKGGIDVYTLPQLRHAKADAKPYVLILLNEDRRVLSFEDVSGCSSQPRVFVDDTFMPKEKVTDTLGYLIGRRYVPELKAYVSELSGWDPVVGPDDNVDTTKRNYSRITIRVDEAGNVSGFDFG